jgi:mono/diheme cytochrome c family protein
MIRTSKELLLVLKTLSIALLLAGGLSVSDVAAQDGEKLFKANCASCHKIDRNLTGPALQGTTTRWAGKEELLHLWIKNPNAAIATGDSYIRALLAEWEPKGGRMPAQAVNDEEINAILAYIDAWVPPAPPTTPDGGVVVSAPVDGGLSTTWLLIVLFILLILIFSLWGVRSSLGKLNNAMRDAQGLETEPELTLGERSRNWLWQNKVFVSITGILVVVYMITLGWDALLGVGVYTGYTPEQPIKFNHTLHAGDNGIACVYCHHSATKSKHAGIPSANICMNCHKGINQGRSEEGTAEIQKIYAAVGWDPDAMAFTGVETPIQWVKVHNLPDHAYFNHAQHYVVGQIECQECHGQIQAEYTVAGQHSPLTMGWCIDCHNRTEVKMEGNGYYDEVHKRLVDSNKEELKNYLEDGVITARELGGWECAKCHY